MRTTISLLLVALAAPAAAEPITKPSHCEVTISRAPDDVRAAIEAWVGAEPHCATTLDIRVVPTEGGYYLFARDAAGRVRERVVPDAQTAGVLVASWVADDGIAPPVPPAAPPPPPPEPELVPPSAAPVVVAAPRSDGVVAQAPARRGGRWLALGGYTAMYADGADGLRAELELVTRGRWTLGAAISGLTSDDTLDGITPIELTDITMLATLSRTTKLGGKWTMRFGAGAGVLVTRATMTYEGERLEAYGGVFAAEVSLLFARELGARWGVAIGPVLSWSGHELRLQHEPGGGMTTVAREDLEPMLFGGIRRRL